MTSDDKHLHTGELKERMPVDATAISNNSQQLQESIDPKRLDSSIHSEGNIVHIESGRMGNDRTVNVHEAVSTGT